MAYNDDGEPICHFCGEVVYLDEKGTYFQSGYAWIKQHGWTTTSNHALDIQWVETYAHESCLKDYLSSRKEPDGSQAGL